ncbi:MAG TPA: hypothetical protein VM942_11575 [Acidimicrobiales bacterium]|nr:hypothetical protein [Acidimicrobiales bacterium]
MSGVWLVIVPIAIIALLLVLKALRDVARSMRKLVDSAQDLRDAGVSLSKVRDELAARRTIEEPPPQ